MQGAGKKRERPRPKMGSTRLRRVVCGVSPQTSIL